MATRLTPEQRTTAIAALPLWQSVTGRDAIERTFAFKDFNEAFGFMTRAALIAEQMNHHPEWRNVWNRVHVVLSTHDASGLTDLDIKLATAMDQLVAKTAR
jgi:4a-hydroxytetrahydrobiopterin dehydratase